MEGHSAIGTYLSYMVLKVTPQKRINGITKKLYKGKQKREQNTVQDYNLVGILQPSFNEIFRYAN